MRDYDGFAQKARLICKNRVFTSPLTTFAYGVDASCYSYIPRVVVWVQKEYEVKEILHLAREYGVPLTFRAAGSSLSGQASSDCVLVVANEGFKKIKILDDGLRIALGCGVIGDEANKHLMPYGTRIGPDPATIKTALIGGIVANNSSGMCCGIEQNSYNTIDSVRIILADGTLLDTSDTQSIDSFLRTHQNMVEQLYSLRNSLLQDDALSRKVRQKYSIKNTTGFGLNSLLDYENIVDILNHLVVGSEGALCFISEVVFNCVPDYAHSASGLVFYPDLYQASLAVMKLAKLDRSILMAAEIMDYECLLACAQIQEMSSFINDIKEDTTCLLLKTQGEDSRSLEQKLQSIEAVIKTTLVARPSRFSLDPHEQSTWWQMRKSLLPITAKSRPKGSTVITEDICFKVSHLCEGIAAIRGLFSKYKYKGILFGHALSGNVHFVITPSFSTQQDRDDFKNFMKDLSLEVSARDGSIKAEHGTGRMVAPFVEVEWGSKAYSIHKAIKEIFDPSYLLNPDVIISQKQDIYVQNLKIPYIRNKDFKQEDSKNTQAYALSFCQDFIENCIECGFCERACPSKFLTLTPRQRIASLREIARLRESHQKEDRKRSEQMLSEYRYYGVETCATCSLCESLCPVNIDSGILAATLSKKKTNFLINYAYRNMYWMVVFAKLCLGAGNFLRFFLGAHAAFGLTLYLHSVLRNFFSKLGLRVRIPILPVYLPRKNSFNFYSFKDLYTNKHNREVVYFSTCINRTFAPCGSFSDTRSLQEVLHSIANKANVSLIYPKNLKNLCCGKAFDWAEGLNREFLFTELRRVSRDGEIPILMDHSSCYEHLRGLIQGMGLVVMDSTEFIYEITKGLSFKKISQKIAVHEMCMLKKTKKENFILKLARMCSDEVYVIDSFECCGFAGGKGFFTPQLNLSSTSSLKSQLQDCEIGVSSSSTCEIGLSQYSGIQFQNVAYVVDRCLES